MKRAEGYYFVFYGGGWRIAYYTDSPIGGCWYMVGHDTTYFDYSFSQIDENQIKRAEDETV